MPNAGAPPNIDYLRLLIRKEAREMEERQKRKTSIIIRGIQAQSAATLKPVFDQVCNHLLGSVVPLTDIVCINKEVCIIRAKIHDEVRKQLLDNAKRLRNSTFSDVFINRDLTYKQSGELRIRRAQNRRTVESAPPQPNGTAVTHSSSVVGSRSIPRQSLTGANASAKITPPQPVTGAEALVPAGDNLNYLAVLNSYKCIFQLKSWILQCK